MGEGPIAVEALVRIIIAVLVVLLLLFPACSKIRDVFFNPEAKFTKSFDQFVEDINGMGKGIESFSLLLKEESALIGMSKDGNGYKHVILDGPIKVTKATFKKPFISECSGSACLCICSDLSNTVEKTVAVISCKNLYCKELKTDDISSHNIIKFNSPTKNSLGQYIYWEDGLFYGRSLDVDKYGALYNGLLDTTSESNTFRVEKRKVADRTLVNLCSPAIYSKDGTNKRNKFFGDKCIITEYDEAEVFREFLKDDIFYVNRKEQILKITVERYNTFIDKYKKGTEVETSLFRIGELYLKQDKKEEAKEAFNKLLKDHPETQFKEQAEERLKILEPEKPELETN